MERAAFNASWLAHAIVDGLTPAHHYPYEKLTIRGAGIESSTTIKDKLIIPGDNMGNSFKKNWAMWGKYFSMHVMFELGIAAMLAPLRLKRSRQMPTSKSSNWPGAVVRTRRAQIALLDMYDRFYEKGWTVKTARQVRNRLGTVIIKTVCLAWFGAARDAGLLKGKK